MIDTSHIDLRELISGLTWEARTGGGEYSGSCPFCGGHDRFRVWPHTDHPGWWCRQCEEHGDAITLVMKRDHLDWREALRYLGLDGGEYTRPERAIRSPKQCTPPTEAWQTWMKGFVRDSFARLYGANEAPLRYLHTWRGLNDATISQFGVGYNETLRRIPRETLGLAPDIYRDENGKERIKKDIWIPRGIVIPYVIDDALWKVVIRLPPNSDEEKQYGKYRSLSGGSNALFNAGSIQYGKPVMMVEGQIDAMAVYQEAGDLIVPVASSTKWAREMRWICLLARAKPLLLAYDRDEPGTKAMAYWRHAFPNSTTWRTPYADPAQLLKDGADVRGWVQAGLRYALREPAQPASVQTPHEPAPAQPADDQMPPAQPAQPAPACEPGIEPQPAPDKTRSGWQIRTCDRHGALSRYGIYYVAVGPDNQQSEVFTYRDQAERFIEHEAAAPDMS